MLINEWKATPPAIIEGKVVFAAPDGNALHCLDLHRGKLLWKANRADGDLYFAGVFGGKAIIVNKDSVRGDRLADGKEAWNIANTGVPSGQGVASEQHLLPAGQEVRRKRGIRRSSPSTWSKGVIHGPDAGPHQGARRQVPGARQPDLLRRPGDLADMTSLISYP